MKKLITMASVLAVAAGFAFADELGDAPRWYVSPGVGMMFFEGNQTVDDPLNLVLRLGYDWSEHISFELEGSDALNATANGHHGYKRGGNRWWRRNWSDRNWNRGWWRDEHKIKAQNIWGVGADVLFHYDRYAAFDPYLSVGWAYYHAEDRIFCEGSEYNVTGPRLGIGAFYHITENWALRADGRASVTINDPTWETMYTADLGIAYYFGGGANGDSATKVGDATALAGTGAAVAADDDPSKKDSDGDGLTDAEEAQLGTDPHKKDTDGDGLTDFEEVRVYKTDPLNPDTDFDGLKDGEEIHKYKTSPIERDTDKGGVSDGHEVLIDHTNPLDPSDDLMLFELSDVQFDYDTTVIKAKYFPELDQVARVLVRNPNASAIVEGHADQRQRSNKVYNQNLSERRAKAVADYLIQRGAKADKVTSKGYGFTRPKVQPDLINGNPENRRVEIYIRGAGTNADKAKYAK
ncbi:MAG: OmpA family protein [Kiritimatiellae bacterium]|nr:OmpA family protein [Kiritimatiellia bacterium]